MTDETGHTGFKALLASIRSGFSRFPLIGVYTLLASILGTIDVIVTGSFNLTRNWATIFQGGSMGCMMGAAVVLVVCLVLERHARSTGKEPDRITLPLIVSLPFVVATTLTRTFLTDNAFLGSYVYLGVIVACVCASYCLLADKDEGELFSHLLKSLVFVCAVSLLLFTGLAVCVAAFFTLVLTSNWITATDDSMMNAIVILAYIVFCFVFVNLFCSYLPRRDETPHLPRSYEVIMAHVLLPVYLALIAVLYAYIIKIIVTWSMPSGEMNWYGSFALLAFAVLWMGLRTNASRLAKWFMRWGWILLIPVTIVQAVGVWIRQSTYGFTPLRYLSLALLLIGVFVLVLAACKGRPATLFAVTGVVALIVTVSPLNALDVSTFDQQQRLEAALSEADMLEGDTIVPLETTIDADLANRIWSSYDYLVDADFGWCHPSFVTDFHRGSMESPTFKEMMGFSAPESSDGYGSGETISPGRTNGTDASSQPSTLFQFTVDQAALDVTGYTKVYRYGIGIHITAQDDWRLQQTWSDGTILDVAIDDWVEHLQALASEPDTADTTNIALSPSDATIDCGNGRKFFADSISVDIKGDAVDWVNVYGYLLVP